MQRCRDGRLRQSMFMCICINARTENKRRLRRCVPSDRGHMAAKWPNETIRWTRSWTQYIVYWNFGHENNISVYSKLKIVLIHHTSLYLCLTLTLFLSSSLSVSLSYSFFCWLRMNWTEYVVWIYVDEVEKKKPKNTKNHVEQYAFCTQ